MTKHPLAAVILLAFITGGAAAVILNYPPRHPADFRESVEKTADSARGTASEADASGARPAEVSDEAEDGAVEDEKSSGVMRGRLVTNGQAAERPRAPAAYVRVSRAQAPPAGRGVAGRTVGGVKKTGQGVKKAGAAIGKTFGKIGGVFND